MSTHVDEGTTSSLESRAPAIPTAAPTLEEIVQLTHYELTTAQEEDSIIECGRAALSLLRTNSDLCAKLAYQKLHDVPYKEVKTCWRRLYTDASLRKVVDIAKRHANQTQTNGDWIDEAVKLLDMTLILTGAPAREEVVELWFSALESMLSSNKLTKAAEPLEPPVKKLRLEHVPSIPSTFPSTSEVPQPMLRRPVPRFDSLPLSTFQKKLSSPATHTPVIIENAIHYWPALSDRPWNDPNYLLKQTLGGRRLVPIETGRSYTDLGWGQRISTFKDFISTYMLSHDTLGGSERNKAQTGYLAQHDLFAQIPSLRADISVPDYCYCEPAPNPLKHIRHTPKLEDPQLNAWFGPKGTISPLHTDPYHNVLAQVVGFKYVRLYGPDQTEWLYPRNMDESGVDMSNTSQVDLDQAMDACPEIAMEEKRADGVDADTNGKRGNVDERRKDFEKQYPGFAQAKYFECILGPGECLYLPPGWWHYVKSLSSSFSVSFWFN